MLPTRTYMGGTGVVQERRKGNVVHSLWCAGSSIGAWGADSALLLRSECSDGCCYMKSLYLIGTYLEVITVEGTRALLPGPQSSIDPVCTTRRITRHPDYAHLRSSYLKQWALHLWRSCVRLAKTHLLSVTGNFFKDILFVCFVSEFQFLTCLCTRRWKGSFVQ